MPPIQAPVTMPIASSSRVRGEGGEEVWIGVQRLDQRREHLVGDVDDQPDVVAFQRRQHDVVPGSPFVFACRSWRARPPQACRE